MSKILNIALIGQGRSGRDIHGAFFLTDEAKKLYNVSAVVELNEKRRERAKNEFGCDVYDDYKKLFDRTDIDLVLNSTYSYEHFPITMDLLNHGLNVVCEKPFSKYAMECEQMINCARKNGVMLSVFQQSRFAPYYEKVKEIIASGVLGNICQITASFSGYARRWDWQCSNRYYGGALLNTGPHPMDQAIDLLGIDDMPNVFSVLKKINSSGDAEDYARVILTYPGKPLIEVEINCADAYSEYLYKVCGDRGTLLANMGKFKYKYFDDKPLPELNLESLTLEDGVSPAYCKETLDWHEVEGEVGGTAFDVAAAKYYQNIYNHLTCGEELIIKPEKVLQQIRVIELVHAQNPLPTEF